MKRKEAKVREGSMLHSAYRAVDASIALSTGTSRETIAKAFCRHILALPLNHLARSLFFAQRLLLMFLVYEACLGIYYPAMGTCRSKYIDDRVRGTVMNITRYAQSVDWNEKEARQHDTQNHYRAVPRKPASSVLS